MANPYHGAGSVDEEEVNPGQVKADVLNFLQIQDLYFF